MKLLTAEILKAFEKQGRCDTKKAEDIKVIVKFFNPTGAGSWFASEYNPKDRCFFGYVNLGDKEMAELGYFSLDELTAYRGRFGLGIERDLHFREHTLKEVMEKY